MKSLKELVKMLSKKNLLYFGSAMGIIILSGLYLNSRNEQMRQQTIESISAEWVHVDGLCQGNVKAGSIDGIDITADLHIVKNGKKRKITNMDFDNVEKTVVDCNGYGQFTFSTQISINTNRTSSFLLGLNENGIEAIKFDEKLFFKFTPEFKNKFDDAVKFDS